MQVDYRPFIDRVIKRYEGGYGWNKKDPGGPTKYGVTCFDLAEHRGEEMTSMVTWAPLVQDMPLSEAETIYASKYALGVNFNSLPPGVDCALLDYGINSGVARAVHVVAAIARHPAETRMSLELLNAIAQLDPARLVNQICDERLAFMKRIRDGSAWAEFGKGWGARVADVRDYAGHLAVGQAAAPAAPDLTHVVTPKATNVPKTAGATTSVGVGGGVATAASSGLSWQTCVLIGTGILAAGVVYEAWQAHKSATANATVHI